MITRQIDCFHLGLLERVLRGTLIAAGLSTAAALAVGPTASFGVAAGAVASLVFVALHRRVLAALVRRQVEPGSPVISLIWLAKWPLVAVPLYYALKSGLIAGSWFCVGFSLMPAVAVALALRALCLDLYASAFPRRSSQLP